MTRNTLKSFLIIILFCRTLNQVREKKKKVSKFLEVRQEKWDTALACARMREQTIQDQIAMKKHLQRAKVLLSYCSLSLSRLHALFSG